METDKEKMPHMENYTWFSDSSSFPEAGNDQGLFPPPSVWPYPLLGKILCFPQFFANPRRRHWILTPLSWSLLPFYCTVYRSWICRGLVWVESCNKTAMFPPSPGNVKSLSPIWLYQSVLRPITVKSGQLTSNCLHFNECVAFCVISSTHLPPPRHTYLSLAATWNHVSFPSMWMSNWVRLLL